MPTEREKIERRVSRAVRDLEYAGRAAEEVEGMQLDFHVNLSYPDGELIRSVGMKPLPRPHDEEGYVYYVVVAFSATPESSYCEIRWTGEAERTYPIRSEKDLEDIAWWAYGELPEDEQFEVLNRNEGTVLFYQLLRS